MEKKKNIPNVKMGTSEQFAIVGWRHPHGNCQKYHIDLNLLMLKQKQHM